MIRILVLVISIAGFAYALWALNGLQSFQDLTLDGKYMETPKEVLETLPAEELADLAYTYINIRNDETEMWKNINNKYYALGLSLLFIVFIQAAYIVGSWLKTPNKSSKRDAVTGAPS